MQADGLRRLFLSKVAMHRLPDHSLKFMKVFALRHNASSRPRSVPGRGEPFAFLAPFDVEGDLSHGPRLRCFCRIRKPLFAAALKKGVRQNRALIGHYCDSCERASSCTLE